MRALHPLLVVLLAIPVCADGAELPSVSTTPVESKATRPAGAIPIPQASASSHEPDCPAAGAADGDRFSTSKGTFWLGAAGAKSWYWQAEFPTPVEVGSILQVLGDDESQLKAAPLSYVWQASDDGATWRDLESAKTSAEYRMFRIHRLDRPINARFLRLSIASTAGAPPAIREIEFYKSVNAAIDFPKWILCVNSFETPSVDECQRFSDLARDCDGWKSVRAQFLWHGYVAPEIALAEPAPACAFYSGSFRDWCEVDRSTWRGTERLLESRRLPMWCACGGAQAFGILSDTGCDQPWDCPKCRDSQHPKLPIYGHIGLLDAAIKTSCGNYSNNIYEAGLTPVRRVQPDPVFAGLPEEFQVPENHCGQLEYLPDKWDLVVTKGKGGKTWMQCMKRRGACIYAAQFHIELPGSPEVSRKIMSNFLAEACRWSADRVATLQTNDGVTHPETNHTPRELPAIPEN